MLKTGKDLLISDKFLENTIINKGAAQEFYSKSPNPLLKRYIDEFQYTEQDAEQIQKLINYCVVRYIKTDKTKNLQDNIRRWKYVNKTIEEYKTYFPKCDLNTKAFIQMKEELIAIIFN